MRKGSALALVSVMFLLGALAGGLITHLVYVDRMQDHAHTPRFHHFGPELESHLQLTPEQASRIHAVLDENREAIMELRNQMVPEIHELLDITSSEIEEILTPEQREVFRAHLAEIRRRVERGPRRRGERHRRREDPPPESTTPPEGATAPQDES